MAKRYIKLTFANGSLPALNATNLNAISTALDECDTLLEQHEAELDSKQATTAATVTIAAGNTYTAEFTYTNIINIISTSDDQYYSGTFLSNGINQYGYKITKLNEYNFSASLAITIGNTPSVDLNKIYINNTSGSAITIKIKTLPLSQHGEE